jgi:uncharacterized protein DUF4411
VPPTYICDSNSFRVISNYYPDAFPSFWDQLNRLVTGGRFGSVREVKKEIDNQNASEHLSDWCDLNQLLFPPPTEDEMHGVAEILAVPHFAQLIGEKQRLRGLPVADPFLIAKARGIGAIVITEEVLKPNAAKIPNVCEHFGVSCTDVRGFLLMEGWRF